MSNEKVLTIPVQWDSVAFPRSRAYCPVIRLVGTQEMIAKAQRDELRHLIDDDAIGHIMFIPNGMDYSNVTIPKERAPEPGFKSKSQRLRGVIFRYWEAQGSNGDFELFYADQLTYLINSYKELLPPRDDRDGT